jgi:aryl-alcohol dehydrogenase-like predicted oxidoreductase
MLSTGLHFASESTGGLTEGYMLSAVARSLARLGVETIDLYFAHWPDPAGTSCAETLGAFDKLMKSTPFCGHGPRLLWFRMPRPQ